VDYKVRIEPPKSRNGIRTLPLDDELVSALTELRKRQAKESETAGNAYRASLATLDWYTAGDEYVEAWPAVSEKATSHTRECGP